MPDSNYTIEARSLGVVGVASHDFWVLRDPQGKALAELHGLATERETNTPKAIGTDEDKFSLRIWQLYADKDFADERGGSLSRFTYMSDDQQHMTVLSAGKEEVMARWNAAAAAIKPLNAADLDYPNYGFKVFSDTVNSNSAYRTLGEIMGVAVKDFPGVVEPGIDNRMTTKEQIDKLRTHEYPVLEKPMVNDQGQYKELPDKSSALHPSHPGHADHTLYQQALYGANQAKVPVQENSGGTHEPMAASLTVLAKQAGLSRIDHVVMSEQRAGLKAGENVFVVEGNLGDPAHNRAHMKTQAALETPLGSSLGQLQSLNESPMQRSESKTSQLAMEQAGKLPDQEAPRRSLSA
jgi:hypothetical protein